MMLHREHSSLPLTRAIDWRNRATVCCKFCRRLRVVLQTLQQLLGNCWLLKESAESASRLLLANAINLTALHCSRRHIKMSPLQKIRPERN